MSEVLSTTRITRRIVASDVKHSSRELQGWLPWIRLQCITKRVLKEGAIWAQKYFRLLLVAYWPPLVLFLPLHPFPDLCRTDFAVITSPQLIAQSSGSVKVKISSADLSKRHISPFDANLPVPIKPVNAFESVTIILITHFRNSCYARNSEIRELECRNCILDFDKFIIKSWI